MCYRQRLFHNSQYITHRELGIENCEQIIAGKKHRGCGLTRKNAELALPLTLDVIFWLLADAPPIPPENRLKHSTAASTYQSWCSCVVINYQNCKNSREVTSFFPLFTFEMIFSSALGLSGTWQFCTHSLISQLFLCAYFDSVTTWADKCVDRKITTTHSPQVCYKLRSRYKTYLTVNSDYFCNFDTLILILFNRW